MFLDENDFNIKLKTITSMTWSAFKRGKHQSWHHRVTTNNPGLVIDGEHDELILEFDVNIVSVNARPKFLINMILISTFKSFRSLEVLAILDFWLKVIQDACVAEMQNLNNTWVWLCLIC